LPYLVPKCGLGIHKISSRPAFYKGVHEIKDEDLAVKFTKKSLDALALPKKDKPYSKIFHDDVPRGFALRVTSNGAKTYIINRKMDGKVLRMNVGAYCDFKTVTQARECAEELLCCCWY
jgi:hypothetical protein